VIGALPKEEPCQIGGIRDQPDIDGGHGAEQDQGHTEKTETSIEFGAKFQNDEQQANGEEEGANDLK
jgi:hypothetical protein